MAFHYLTGTAAVRFAGLLTLLLTACSRSDDALLVPVLQPSPYGGVIWSATYTASGWVSIGPSGTYLSADLASGWTRVGSLPDGAAKRFSLFATSKKLYAERSGELFSSTDGGRHWSELGRYTAVAAAGDEALVAGSIWSFIRSFDGGLTWSDTIARGWGGFQPEFMVSMSDGVYVADRQDTLAIRIEGGSSWHVLPAPNAAPARQQSASWLESLVAVGDTLFAQVDSSLLVSYDRGESWARTQITFREYTLYNASLVGAGRGVVWSANPADCEDREARVPVAEDNRNAGRFSLRCAPSELYDVDVLPGWTVASTSTGVYRSADDGMTWEPVSRGIPVALDQMVKFADSLIAVSSSKSFIRRGASPEWSLYPAENESLVKVREDSGYVIASTGSYLRLCEPATHRCMDWPPEDLRPSEPFDFGLAIKTSSLAHQGRTVVVEVCDIGVSRPYIVVSKDFGRSWNANSQDEGCFRGFSNRLFLIDSLLYTVRSSVVDESVWFSRDWGASWKRISFFDEHLPNAISRAGDGLLMGTRGGRLVSIEMRSGVPAVQPLLGHGLEGEILHLWVDQTNPQVIIAAGWRRLFWSNDHGAHFLEAALDTLAGGGTPNVSGLFDIDGQPYLATDQGIYLLQDNIPRAGLPGRIGNRLGEWHKQHYAALWYKPFLALLATLCAYVLGLVAILVIARTGGTAVLRKTRLRRIMRRVLLEAPGLSRRALFLGYSKRLRDDRLVRQAGDDFFGLSAEDSDGVPVHLEEQGRTLIARIAEAVADRRIVLLLGSGGAGKSTVLGRLAWLGSQNRLPPPLRGYRPILVPASYYQGDLGEAIADVLRERYGVDVNRETLLPQLETGAFLILFDGASEIETINRESAFDTLLRQAMNTDFVRCRVVIASRPLAGLVPDVPYIRLLPLSPDVVSLLLPRYHLGTAGEARVRRQLEKFGTRPIAPLLFALAVSDRNGDSEDLTRAGLYERYFRRLLGVSGDGGRLQWAGWRMVLGHIANWSLLQTGLRGIGVLHEQLVAGLQQPDPSRENLTLSRRLTEFFDVKLPDRSTALEVVKRLSAAGILEGGPPKRWRFAHDTFEEFFAAAYLVDVREATGAWPDVSKWCVNAERKAEFRDVLSFAVEMEQQHLFPDSLESDPDEWFRIQNRAEHNDHESGSPA